MKSKASRGFSSLKEAQLGSGKGTIKGYPDKMPEDKMPENMHGQNARGQNTRK